MRGNVGGKGEHESPAFWWAALQRATGFGAAGLLRMAAIFGSPWAALNASVEELMGLAGLSLARAERVVAGANRPDLIERKIEEWKRNGIQLVCIDDEAYPSSLLDLRSPPPLLYVRGELAGGDERTAAVVGSRECSSEGAELAKWLAKGLAGYKFTIVSGLARGIDTAGHVGALESEEGRTVAVLGCGLLRIYPPENASLAERITDRGCLIAEVPPETEVAPGLLLARDRIQAGLSRAVMVAQSQWESGSMVTARYAVQSGRLLYGVPWREPPFSDGWARLWSMGARPITRKTDLGLLRAEIERWKRPPRLPLD